MTQSQRKPRCTRLALITSLGHRWRLAWHSPERVVRVIGPASSNEHVIRSQVSRQKLHPEPAGVLLNSADSDDERLITRRVPEPDNVALLPSRMG